MIAVESGAFDVAIWVLVGLGILCLFVWLLKHIG